MLECSLVNTAGGNDGAHNCSVTLQVVDDEVVNQMLSVSAPLRMHSREGLEIEQTMSFFSYIW